MLDTDTWIWFLIVPFVGASMGLLFLPKKGPQYAYRNWGRLQVLLICLWVAVIIVGGILGFAYLLPKDTPDVTATVAMTVLFGLGLAGVYVYGQRMGPTVGRKSWLRKRYPRVAEAIQRYQQKSDLRELYMPALRLDGRSCFLVFYHDSKNVEVVRGGLLLDEEGSVLEDPQILRRVAKCKAIAIQTVDYRFHQRRAAEIMAYGQAMKAMQAMFNLLRQEKERFAQLGNRAMDDLGKVMAAEDAIQRFLEGARRIKMLEAEWAVEHGMRKLTEVSLGEVIQLEEEMRRARAPLLERLDDLTGAVEPARRLAEVVPKMRGLKHRKDLREALLALGDAGDGLEQEVEFEYGRMSETDRQAWQERTAWALKQGARGSEAAA